MNRRANLLFLIPLLAALVVYFVFQDLIVTTVAFVVGYLVMEGLRFRLVPPHLHQAARRYQRGDLESALMLTEKAIAARPQRWESYYLQSLIYFNSSDLKRAEQSAKKAIELDPEQASINLILGQILFAQGLYKDAQSAFDAALRQGGKTGIHYYHAAAAAYRLENCEEASPRLELALRLGVDNPQLVLLAKYYLATCLEKRGEQDVADRYFEQLGQHKEELESLRHDLHIVPDFPERVALSNDVQAIARYVPVEPPSRNR